MKVLITGVTGFAGSHLAEYWLKKGAEVHGTTRWRSDMSNIDGILPVESLHNCDIRDAFSVAKTVSEVKPDIIHHLAAQSFVLESWRAPAETLTTNIIGTLNILEAVRQNPCVVHIAGSSEEYGNVEKEIDEDTPLSPMSPYGVSKAAVDMLGYQYSKSYKIPVVITRAFNHTGPRRGEVFVTSSFAKQIAEIAAGKRDPVISHGNLNAIRDWTDVRDIVRGYAYAASAMIDWNERGPMRFVLCSGVGRSVQSVLDDLLEISGEDIPTEQDPGRMRPSDIMRLVGNNKRAGLELDWTPEIPWEKTLTDLYNYWMVRV